MVYFNKEEYRKQFFELCPIFKNDEIRNLEITKKKNEITFILEEKKAYIFLDEKEHFSAEKVIKSIIEIVKHNKYGFEINIPLFASPLINEAKLVDLFTFWINYESHLVWNLKTINDKKIKNHFNLIANNSHRSTFDRATIEVKNVNLVRDLQNRPHNYLNSEIYEKEICKIFESYTNVKIQTLAEDDPILKNMGLFLSVNKGSAYKPKCVILSYRNNPSNEHTVLVGKGITFDSGGINLKLERFMIGMKMDMSGSAIALGVIKTIADLNLKVNVSAVLMITDNMISPFASKPDDVAIALNGMSVEINNTDAEGRLVMADGLVYAWKHLGATKIVDIATLTGAVLVALGSTYTGVWSTSDLEWAKFENASNKASELVWRMPFHKNFAKQIKDSKIADLKNTDFSGKAGSSSAAMFLKEFTNNLPYIHLDIAGSSVNEENPTGIMIRTLTNYVAHEG